MSEHLSVLGDGQLRRLDQWLEEELNSELAKLRTKVLKTKGNNESFTREISQQAGRIEQVEHLRVKLKDEQRNREKAKAKGENR